MALLEWNHWHRTSIKCSCKPLIKKNACSFHIPYPLVAFALLRAGTHDHTHCLSTHTLMCNSVCMAYEHLKHYLFDSFLRSIQHTKDGNLPPAYNSIQLLKKKPKQPNNPWLIHVQLVHQDLDPRSFLQSCCPAQPILSHRVIVSQPHLPSLKQAILVSLCSRLLAWMAALPFSTSTSSSSPSLVSWMNLLTVHSACSWRLLMRGWRSSTPLPTPKQCH